jgi:hypothetical protein
VSQLLPALAARRTAILAAALAVAQVLQAAVRAGEVTLVVVLGALGAAGLAYIAAYQAIGLLEKQIATVIVTALAGVVAGIEVGLSATDIALGVLIVVIVGFGGQALLPSTQGSVPEQAALFDRNTIVGEVFDTRHDVDPAARR